MILPGVLFCNIVVRIHTLVLCVCLLYFLIASLRMQLYASGALTSCFHDHYLLLSLIFIEKGLPHCNGLLYDLTHIDTIQYVRGIGHLKHSFLQLVNVLTQLFLLVLDVTFLPSTCVEVVHQIEAAGRHSSRKRLHLR